MTATSKKNGRQVEMPVVSTAPAQLFALARILARQAAREALAASRAIPHANDMEK
jgi:hypothetical protein